MQRLGVSHAYPASKCLDIAQSAAAYACSRPGKLQKLSRNGTGAAPRDIRVGMEVVAPPGTPDSG